MSVLQRPLTFRLWGDDCYLESMEVPRPKGLVTLWGPSLRQAALAVLDDRRKVMSIGQILDALEDRGVVVGSLADLPHKALADALGQEVRRGRAKRVGHGRYAIGRLAPTTRWRVERRWGLRSWPSAV